MLFIFFNEIGFSVEQWKHHPFDDAIKTSLLTKIKKFGEVFVYNPIFYNFFQFNKIIKNHKYNKEYVFEIKSIDLIAHCKRLFSEVYKLDSDFVLISHADGYIISHIFADLYKDNVKAIININGGHTSDWYKRWLEQDKNQFIKKIKDRELKQLFYNLEKNKIVNETISLIDQVVKYYLYKQYMKIPTEFECPVIIFNNLCMSDGFNTMDKFKFSNQMSKLNDNVKTFNYLDKSDLLYFDIEKELVEIIKKVVEDIKVNEVVNY